METKVFSAKAENLELSFVKFVQKKLSSLVETLRENAKLVKHCETLSSEDEFGVVITIKDLEDYSNFTVISDTEQFLYSLTEDLKSFRGFYFNSFGEEVYELDDLIDGIEYFLFKTGAFIIA